MYYTYYSVFNIFFTLNFSHDSQLVAFVSLKIHLEEFQTDLCASEGKKVHDKGHIFEKDKADLNMNRYRERLPGEVM